MRRAVIDVGTNTVKLLVADVRSDEIRVVAQADTSTRLGENLQRTGQLNPAAVARTVTAVATYYQQARDLGATDIRAFTTSAARDAANGAEFLAAVRDRCGLAVEVISGDREAALIYRGVVSDPHFARRPVLVLDVGGGSAELMLASRRVSLPLGAVRLTEMFPNDFAGLCAHIRATLAEVVPAYRQGFQLIVGTGGTIITLARLLRPNANHQVLPAAELRSLVLRLNAMPLAQRRQLSGLPPDRADIIVAGGMVFVLALEALGASELTCCTRSLRYGALLEPG
jgi:exopolyphosphatase/guanosine-5'-triphosphate,3'-diphosphate pyrophosphatase